MFIPFWAIIFGYTQLHKSNRYIASIIALIGYCYLWIDIKQEWITGFLFFGYENRAGEFTKGYYESEDLVNLMIFNTVCVLFTGLFVRNYFLMKQGSEKPSIVEIESDIDDDESYNGYNPSIDDINSKYGIKPEKESIVESKLVNAPKYDFKNVEVSVKKDSPTLLKRIIVAADIIDSVYLIDGEDGIQLNTSSRGDVSGWSGWGGLMEQTGVRNAQKKMAAKAKQLGCNVIFVTSSSYSFGVKFSGKAYKIEETA